jgi:ABC-2 type transport system ATP-binding protein
MEEAETLADIVAIILDGKIRAMETTANLINNHGCQTKLVIHGGGTRAFEALRRWRGTELSDIDVIVPLRNKKDLTKIVDLLDQRQIAFDEIEMKKPSLEDVFLDLTATNWEGVS